MSFALLESSGRLNCERTASGRRNHARLLENFLNRAFHHLQILQSKIYSKRKQNGLLPRCRFVPDRLISGTLRSRTHARAYASSGKYLAPSLWMNNSLSIPNNPLPPTQVSNMYWCRRAGGRRAGGSPMVQYVRAPRGRVGRAGTQVV